MNCVLLNQLSQDWLQLQEKLKDPEKNRSGTTRMLLEFQSSLGIFVEQFRRTSKSYSHSLPQTLLGLIGSFLTRSNAWTLRAVCHRWYRYVRSSSFEAQTH